MPKTVATTHFCRGDNPLRRIIVKKLVSLLIAMMLIVSVFAVSGVAFAEESTTTREDVVFHKDVFVGLDSIKNFGTVVGVTKTFQLDTEWLKNVESVKAVFEHANYVLNTEGEDALAVTSESDIIYVEYVSPSKDYKDTWSRTKVTSTINITSTGWWGFRYVLTNNNGTTSTSESNAENDLAKTSSIYVYFSDEAAPVISSLHSDMITAMKDGISVGKTYTIKTNLSITDTSSTTTTYVVYKKVNGAWTEEPIYDSTTKVVAEGFEDGISTSGVITMLEEDVLADKEPVYKIIYTVKDSLGYVTVVEDELTLFAVAAEKEPLTTSQIWQIVLFAVAGVSLVGIVVVLCIKPKDPESTNQVIDK